MGPQMLRLSFPRRLNRAVHFYDFRESKHIVFMAPKNIKQETAETWGFRLLDKVYDSLFFLTTLRFGEWYTGRFLGTCPSTSDNLSLAPETMLHFPRHY